MMYNYKKICERNSSFMKKLLCISFSLMLMLSFLSACSSSKRYVLQIEDVGVSSGVYTYYLNHVLAYPNLYGVDTENKDEVIEQVNELAQLYAAAKIKDETKSLSTNYKKSAAEDTENIWSLFSSYYNSIGVAKSDITEITLYDYRIKQYINTLYGENGKEPTDEWELKEAFVDIYVGFKLIEAPLTRANDMGETVSLTQSEISSLKKTFQSMADTLNKGEKSIDELNEEYNASLGIIVTSALPVTLMKENDPLYPESFFSDVMSISHGKAAVIEGESSVYLVLRETIATEQEDAFVLYRDEILQQMHKDTIVKKLTKFKNKCNISFDEKMAESLYSSLLAKRENLN